MLRSIYIILNFVAILISLIIPIYIYYPISWFYKTILIQVSAFTLLNISNKFVNEKILPLFLYLNILILLIVQYTINKNNIFAYFILTYLLITFKFKNFKFNNGILLKIDKFWITSYIILLTIWFILLPPLYVSLYSKVGLILLLLYPLLFPLNEYFLHRIGSLSIVTALHWYLHFKSNKKDSLLVRKRYHKK